MGDYILFSKQIAEKSMAVDVLELVFNVLWVNFNQVGLSKRIGLF